jgi:acrylyl-CoA reductase (NADPH)
LDKERWAGAVDSLGSRTLANVLSLAGVNSVFTPHEKREQAWGRLATDLDLAKLNSMTSRARLDDVPALAAEILAGKTRGRVVIDL